MSYFPGAEVGAIAGPFAPDAELAPIINAFKYMDGVALQMVNMVMPVQSMTVAKSPVHSG